MFPAAAVIVDDVGQIRPSASSRIWDVASRLKFIQFLTGHVGRLKDDDVVVNPEVCAGTAMNHQKSAGVWCAE